METGYGCTICWKEGCVVLPMENRMGSPLVDEVVESARNNEAETNCVDGYAYALHEETLYISEKNVALLDKVETVCADALEG